MAVKQGVLVDVFVPQDIDVAIKAGTPFKTAATSLTINPCDYLSHRDLQTIAVSILANPNITCFTINSARRMDQVGWGTLTNALNQSSITQLTINSLALYNNGLSSLSQMLKTNKKITHLYLMQIRANDYSDLGDAFAENTTIKSVFIRMPYRREFNIGLHSIEKGLRGSTSIERFKVAYVELNAFEAICNAFRSHPKIQALEFQEALDPLTPECLVALRHLLETNKSLVKLSLERCKIDQDATIAICEGLMENTNVKELLLDGNSLTDSACKTLAQLLKQNTTLKRLSLTSNSITVFEGMTEICKALLENSTLEWLDIRGNSIGGDFYRYLKQVIGSNTSLNRLEIEDANFTSGHLATMENELQQNKTLTTATFNNAADEASANIWSKILEKNESLTNVGQFSKSIYRPIQFNITDFLTRNVRQQNDAVRNVIISLFNIARDPQSLNYLPIELWCHVCKLIKIPGVSIDWLDVFNKMFANKNQLKVLHKKYL